jgi:NAD(P)-dependent dehydrogenase (short-subunit alcohol dehydrogenase family)
MTADLKDQTVLIIGRGSGLARAIVLAAQAAGAQIIAAGRGTEALSAAYAGEPGVSTETVDLTDETSIAALAGRLGPIDHVISTASARVRGRLADLDRDAISPGMVDTGAWDAFGAQGKADYFADISARNPARRIGTPDEIAQGVLFALTNPFLTGQTLHIDGGETLT